MISDKRCNNISRRCTWASSCATTETRVRRLDETNKVAGIRMKGRLTPQVNGPQSEIADGVENIFTLYRLMLRSRSFGRTDSRVPGSTSVARPVKRLASLPPCKRSNARYEAGDAIIRRTKCEAPQPITRAAKTNRRLLPNVL